MKFKFLLFIKIKQIYLKCIKLILRLKLKVEIWTEEWFLAERGRDFWKLQCLGGKKWAIFFPKLRKTKFYTFSYDIRSMRR